MISGKIVYPNGLGREHPFINEKNTSACSDGSYGDNCTNKCSENCFQMTMCNKISGTCGKCKDGWDSDFCNESKFEFKKKYLQNSM